MKEFVKAEKLIRQYLKEGTGFKYEGIDYVIKFSGKPRPKKGKGEPKTDIYVYAVSTDGKYEKEFKISYKKLNAEFLENKMKKYRAEQIFGSDWQSVITNSIEKIEDKFKKRTLLYLNSYKQTRAGSMTLGWKFELFNKQQGELSGLMENLTEEQVYEIYAGEKLEERKRDSKVKGEIIPKSGVADYILFTDKVDSAQDIIDKSVRIKEYVKDNPDIYFGCKALNYNSKKKKIEGNRDLVVQVDWFVEKEKLEAKLEFEKPLLCSGKDMKMKAEQCLKDMKKKDATQITEEEISGISIYKK